MAARDVQFVKYLWSLLPDERIMARRRGGQVLNLNCACCHKPLTGNWHIFADCTHKDIIEARKWWTSLILAKLAKGIPKRKNGKPTGANHRIPAELRELFFLTPQQTLKDWTELEASTSAPLPTSAKREAQINRHELIQELLTICKSRGKFSLMKGLWDRDTVRLLSQITEASVGDTRDFIAKLINNEIQGGWRQVWDAYNRITHPEETNLAQLEAKKEVILTQWNQLRLDHPNANYRGTIMCSTQNMREKYLRCNQLSKLLTKWRKIIGDKAKRGGSSTLEESWHLPHTPAPVIHLKPDDSQSRPTQHQRKNQRRGISKRDRAWRAQKAGQGAIANHLTHTPTPQHSSNTPHTQPPNPLSRVTSTITGKRPLNAEHTSKMINKKRLTARPASWGAGASSSTSAPTTVAKAKRRSATDLIDATARTKRRRSSGAPRDARGSKRELTSGSVGSTHSPTAANELPNASPRAARGSSGENTLPRAARGISGEPKPPTSTPDGTSARATEMSETPDFGFSIVAPRAARGASGTFATGPPPRSGRATKLGTLASRAARDADSEISERAGLRKGDPKDRGPVS